MLRAADHPDAALRALCAAFERAAAARAEVAAVAAPGSDPAEAARAAGWAAFRAVTAVPAAVTPAGRWAKAKVGDTMIDHARAVDFGGNRVLAYAVLGDALEMMAQALPDIRGRRDRVAGRRALSPRGAARFAFLDCNGGKTR
jgi:hypothetical protein